MKKTIQNLKKLTKHKSDATFAAWLGFTKSTVVRAKRDEKIKLWRLLPMLEWLILKLSKTELKEFLRKFK
jgi:hypothetical protein